jgi:CubicO group peptidase (beta-lactamase class C family)
MLEYAKRVKSNVKAASPIAANRELNPPMDETRPKKTASALPKKGVDNAVLDHSRLMLGFPPEPAYQVHMGNWQHYPQKIWSFQHAREIFPTRPLQAIGSKRPLPIELRALEDLQVGTPDAPQTWPQMLEATHTDALLVLHHGKIIDERYFNGMTPQTPHLIFSATKSMAGLMAAVAIEEGLLDAAARVDSILPELGNSGWAGATVRQVLDMTDGVQFTEVYTDPTSDIFSYIGAMGWAPDLRDPQKPVGIQAMLGSLKNVHPEIRGSAFHYRSPATDVTAWLAARSTGLSLTSWMQQRLWSQLGMEHEGHVMLDPAGTEVAFAGVSASARDLARIGQMLLNSGRVGEVQVIPAAVVNDLIAGGDATAFEADGITHRKGWSYRSQWWVNPIAPRSFAAMGAFGQRLFVLPDDDMVVVVLGSHPQPVASLIDIPQQRAIKALVHHLKQG